MTDALPMRLEPSESGTCRRSRIERRGPESVVQLLPRHGALSVDTEQQEQLKRFGRE
jgi:hypothetical protein